MTEEHAGSSTRTSKVIWARPEELYAAFLDPTALIVWLPPAEMTGEIHEFDARVGGGYRMSLFYPPDERAFRGKTSDREDMVNVRFVELAPQRRIVEAVSFVTTDPAFFGEMTLIATFEEARRNRSHPGVQEPAARLAGGGQRGRLAVVSGAAGTPLRMTDGGVVRRSPTRGAQRGQFLRTAANVRPDPRRSAAAGDWRAGSAPFAPSTADLIWICGRGRRDFEPHRVDADLQAHRPPRLEQAGV